MASTVCFAGMPLVIDASRIVWCRAISPEEDARVIRYYEGRRFWLAEVESNIVRVTDSPLRETSHPRRAHHRSLRSGC